VLFSKRFLAGTFTFGIITSEELTLDELDGATELVG
jgi:hypothetical protein